MAVKCFLQNGGLLIAHLIHLTSRQPNFLYSLN
jgi:hypothetical protein